MTAPRDIERLTEGDYDVDLFELAENAVKAERGGLKRTTPHAEYDAYWQAVADRYHQLAEGGRSHPREVLRATVARCIAEGSPIIEGRSK